MRSAYKKITILFAAMALILMPSCSEEEGFENIPSTPQDREGVITFRIQGKKQPMGYAIATENENVVDSLEIYMFSDDSKKLQKVFRVGKTDLGQTGADLTATINVTGRTGKHIFYFVANGKDNASSLDNIDTGATTEDDFRERLTNIHTGLIETPLLMTTRQVIEKVESPTDPEKQVKLFRRVARFDVVNNATETNFTMENIIIENVNLQGHVFGDAVGTPKPTLATGTLPMINFGEKENANTGTRHESLFYLYPTEIGTDKSTISFEGIFLGERRIYSLKNDQPIEANKRYILKVKTIELNEPEFEIIVNDWNDDGGSYEAEPKSDDMTVGPFVLTDGDGILVTTKTYSVSETSAPGTLTIPVKTSNSLGSRVEVTAVSGSLSDLEGLKVESTTPVLSYSAGYEQIHTISIPKYTSTTTEEMRLMIEVVNESRPEQRDTAYICNMYYIDSEHKAVAVGGVIWAPLNIGATEIGSDLSLGHRGYCYQWGRNTSFLLSGAPSDIYSKKGPVLLKVAMEGDAVGKFITPDIYTNDDWLKPSNPTLWSGYRQQGPCPDGWRVPSAEEFSLLVAAYDRNDGSLAYILGKNILEVKGDNKTDILYFPIAGFRNPREGKHEYSFSANYWSSDADTEGDRSMCLDMFVISGKINWVKVADWPRAYGFPVRCVRK